MLPGVPIAGFSTNISTMIIARGLQGVDLSMFPITFSIVRDQFPREKMAIGQGIITSMFAGGAVIGLSIGGFIIQHYGWQFTFFTIIPIVIALFFVVWRFLHVDPILQPEQQQREESEHTLKKVSSESDKKSSSTGDKARISITLDIKGAITLAIAITSFLIVLTYLQTGGGNNSKIWGISYSTLQIAIFLAAGMCSSILYCNRKEVDISTG
jgi:MFS family permease